MIDILIKLAICCLPVGVAVAWVLLEPWIREKRGKCRDCGGLGFICGSPGPPIECGTCSPSSLNPIAERWK